MSADANAKELGLDLEHPAKPVANYVPAVRTGNLLFVSGQGVIYKYDETAQTYSQVYSGLDASTPLQSVFMGDKLIFFNGV